MLEFNQQHPKMLQSKLQSRQLHEFRLAPGLADTHSARGMCSAPCKAPAPPQAAALQPLPRGACPS